MPKVFPATPTQLRFIPGVPIYNVNPIFRLTGDLDTDVLLKCIDQLVERHELLRTTFPIVDGVRVQQVLDSYIPPKPIVDLRQLPRDRQTAAASEVINGLTNAGFVYENAPPWHFHLFRFGDREYVLSFFLSHTLADAWTQAILLHETLDLYCAAKTGKPSFLTKAPMQFGDYAAWHKNTFTPDFLNARFDFWENKLRGHKSPTFSKHAHPPMQVARKGRRLPRVLGKDVFRELKMLGSKHGVSVYAVLVSCYNILLSKRTGMNNIVMNIVGSPERNRSEVDHMLGPCNSTIPIRTDLSDDPDVKTLFLRVQANIFEGIDHFVPTNDPKNLKRMIDIIPLKKLQLNLLTSVPPPCSFPLPGINKPLEFPRCRYGMSDLAPLDLKVNAPPVRDFRDQQNIDNCEIHIFAMEADNELLFDFWYDVELFNDAEINSIADEYLQLLEDIALQPNLRISEFISSRGA